MEYHRKYSITSDNTIGTISRDKYHSDIENTIKGGFVYVKDNFVLFYGESLGFGRPSIELLQKAISNSLEFDKNSLFYHSDSFNLEEALQNYTKI